jgi:hypothetical protein
MEENPKKQNAVTDNYFKGDDYHKIIEDEKEKITAEKKKLEIDSEKLSGFAISGGGIRSASFGLGVMQALVANDQLYKMDYMSTVSGGGYIGSALTWALHQDKNAGTRPADFPLGKKGVADTPENKRLNYIRQHSNYLLPDDSIGMISFVAVVLRSMLISGFFYTAVLSILMVVFHVFHLFSHFDAGSYMGMHPGLIVNKDIFISIAFVLGGIYLLSVFTYSLGTFFNSKGTIKTYLGFIRGQQLNGILWKSIFTLLILGSLPYVYEFIGGNDWKKEIATASGSTLFGTIVGIWQYSKAQKKEKGSSVFSDVIIYLGVAALMYGLLLFAYEAGIKYFRGDLWFIILTVITLFIGFFVSLNQVGPHRLWRNRLMETFMPDMNAINSNKWEPAVGADSALMKDMCAGKNVRPYHIVNTNLILVDSPSVKYRGRGGDNFIISPLYCGSSATGWRSTGTYQKQVTGITLATAMATSAAALNPNAGVSGAGVTRNTMVSILLSILNLRLGYWSVNPKITSPLLPPNFFMPGLTSEVTRRNLTETSRNILLSDGGHFENLAIYELLRRRAGFIVLSDGGADLEYNFDDLANAVEKARVDFGVKISFKDESLNAILGLSKTDPTLFEKKYNIAERGYAIASITYPGDEKPSGVLIYVKLAMISDLPTDIYSYKGVNPDFPHQSTADQFFNEKQFEAYRELGYNVMWKMMESTEGKILFPPTKTFGDVSQLTF